MTIYIALIRGINVGGKNIVKMAELRHMFGTMGFERVQTYIQSGNVLFESEENEESLRKCIEQQIEVTFGFSIAVVLRTVKEMELISSSCPFSERALLEAKETAEGEILYVSLLAEALSQEVINRISSFEYENEEYQIKGRDIYLLFHRSIRNSKFANNLQKLDVPSTIRNWKTINKLVSLAKAMER